MKNKVNELVKQGKELDRLGYVDAYHKMKAGK